MEDRKNPSSFSHSRMFSLAFPVQGYKSLFYMSICNSNPKEKILYIIVCEQALSLGEKIARKGKGKAGRESLRSRPKKERARKRETREETPLACLPLSRSFFLRPLLPSAWHAGYLSTALFAFPFSSVPRSSKGLFTGYIYYNPRFRATLPRSSRATAISE